MIIGPPSEQNICSYNTLPHQHQVHQQTIIQSNQTACCSSIPRCSAGHLLKRQSSLGQLDDRISSKNKQDVVNERRLSLIQQKIKSFLSSNFKKGDNNSNTSSSNTNTNTKTNSNTNTIQQTQQTIEGSANVNGESSNFQTSTPTLPVINRESVNESFANCSSINDEEDNSVYLRDVCSKWFGRNNQGITMTISSVNKPCQNDGVKISHNFKTTLYDKVAPKDDIYGCTNGDQSNRFQASTSRFVEPKYAEVQRQTNTSSCTSSDPSAYNSVNEQHVVVVSGLENSNGNNTCHDSNLTVRTSECSSSSVSNVNQTNENISEEHFYSNDILRSTSAKIREFPVPSSGTVLQDNYKSSSESGRGTMEPNDCDPNKNDGTIVNSSADLTSLDSDQSANCVSSKNWNQQTDPKELGVLSNNDKIEKMQLELQRILEDGSMQSSEVEVDDLGRDFQSRLSVVNESDSWVSNSVGAPTPPLLTNSNGKSSSLTTKDNCSNTKITDNKSNSLQLNKQKLINERQSLTLPKGANFKQKINSKPPLASTRSSQNHIYERAKKSEGVPSSKNKLRNSSVLLRNRYANLADCDNMSTTTCGRDNDSIADDLCSEYTANTSCWDNDDSFTIKKQLNGLENMYGEVSYHSN